MSYLDRPYRGKWAKAAMYIMAYGGSTSGIKRKIGARYTNVILKQLRGL